MADKLKCSNFVPLKSFLKRNLEAMKSLLILLFAVLMGTTAKAQTVNSIMVSTDSGDLSFVLNDIKCVTFGETAMVIMQNDDTEISFPNANNWSIRFVSSDASSISSANVANIPMQVYDVKGTLVATIKNVAELNFDKFPKGIYIIMFNGKIMKVQL